MGMIITAFDPGDVTGAAMHGDDGPIWSGQGAADDMLEEIYLRVPPGQHALTVIEAAFVGVNNYSSLHVCDAGGYLRGWLAGRGALGRNFWQPMAIQWRADAGLNYHEIGDDGKKRKPKREVLEARGRDLAAAMTGKDHLLLKAMTHEAEAVIMAAMGYERWLEKSIDQIH